MKEYWIEWTALFEGFTYFEEVNEQELKDRRSDSSIEITYIEEI